MFKVGDKVEVISVCGGSFLRVGDIYEVDKIIGNLLYPKGKPGQAMFIERFKLVEAAVHMPLYSTEQAVKWLEKEGFTVTPPPEPLKGKVYINQFQDGNRVVWVSLEEPKLTGSKVIATINWTEGDGL